MGVYIKGMEMPRGRGEYGLMLYVDSDGTATVEGSYCRFEGEPFEAVHVPPHGRLIDADAVLRRYEHELSRTYTDDFAKGFQLGVKAAVGNGIAVVIPAEEGE